MKSRSVGGSSSKSVFLDNSLSRVKVTQYLNRLAVIGLWGADGAHTSCLVQVEEFELLYIRKERVVVSSLQSEIVEPL